jgi:hypothetical protein
MYPRIQSPHLRSINDCRRMIEDPWRFSFGGSVSATLEEPTSGASSRWLQVDGTARLPQALVHATEDLMSKGDTEA